MQVHGAHQALLSMRLSRQEYWSGLLFPSPEDLPDPEIKPKSPLSPALRCASLPAELLTYYMGFNYVPSEKIHVGQ